MPSLFSSLFSAKVLLQIFDRVLSHDVFDLRKDDTRFSFLSSVGLIVLFIVVYTTAQITASKAALGCSIQKLISISGGCTEMWFALATLFGVIGIAYILVILIGKRYSQLGQYEPIMENSCSLFILGCLVLISFNTRLASKTSAFNWVSDLGLEWIGSSGTVNNIIGVFVVGLCTITLSTLISLMRRRVNYRTANFTGPEPKVLMIYYLTFITASLLFTFYEVG